MSHAFVWVFKYVCLSMSASVLNVCLFVVVVLTENICVCVYIRSLLNHVYIPLTSAIKCYKDAVVGKCVCVFEFLLNLGT